MNRGVPSPSGPNGHEGDAGGPTPWSCRWARLAGTMRAARSVETPAVVWTCSARERSSTPLFTRDGCRGCHQWCPQPVASPRGFDAAGYAEAPHGGVVVVRRYERGTTIVEAGSRSDALLTVLSGAVKWFILTPSGKAIGTEVCGPGSPLGAEAVIENVPFPATAVALEATTCVSVSRRAVLDLLRQRPALARQLVCEADERLEALMTRMSDLTASRVETRFGRFFLELARRLGHRERGVAVVKLLLLRQDLADLTCTTLETAIRVMSRWNKLGLVRQTDRSFVIDERKVAAACGLAGR